MRYPLVIGNWKLNGCTKVIKELVQNLCNKLSNIINDCNIVIAPPELYLTQVQQILTKNKSKIMLSAQDVDINLFGSFTGETSAKMLKDIGIKYVIIGHSERRIHHQESNEYIAQKFAIIKSQGLIPVLCIGESEKENSANKTELVCAQQIDAVLDISGIKAFKNSVIAYEPIWAIGTNKPATPVQAQTIHKFIRNYLAKQDYVIAEQVIIQYGGSVDADNAFDLFCQPDIDGALVGRASLDADIFTSIVSAAKTAKKLVLRNY